MIKSKREYKFYSQFHNPPHAKAEKGGGERHVSLTGYVPLEQRIQEMMYAGIKLTNMRSGGRYDTDDYGCDADDIPLDPTREKGIDRAEVSELSRRLASSIQSAREAIRVQKNAKGEGAPAEKAPEGSKEGNKPEVKVSEPPKAAEGGR